MQEKHPHNKLSVSVLPVCRQVSRRMAAIAVFALLGVSSLLRAQMLFSENLTMYIDSTKTIQGTVAPIFEFRTEKKDILVFKNTANLNLLIDKDKVINLINKLELSKYGTQVTLSGGYVHAEYRHLLYEAFEIYPYMEAQWAESRGMVHKLSTGVQSRYRAIYNKKAVAFVTVALFYEYEKWRYAYDAAPAITAITRGIKSHLSLSLKYRFTDHWDMTFCAIHQAMLSKDFLKPRYGGAVDLKYHISKTFGLKAAYRLIYDTNPVVPVRKTYTGIEASLDISF